MSGLSEYFRNPQFPGVDRNLDDGVNRLVQGLGIIGIAENDARPTEVVARTVIDRLHDLKPPESAWCEITGLVEALVGLLRGSRVERELTGQQTFRVDL